MENNKSKKILINSGRSISSFDNYVSYNNTYKKNTTYSDLKSDYFNNKFKLISLKKNQKEQSQYADYLMDPSGKLNTLGKYAVNNYKSLPELSPKYWEDYYKIWEKKSNQDHSGLNSSKIYEYKRKKMEYIDSSHKDYIWNQKQFSNRYNTIGDISARKESPKVSKKIDNINSRVSDPFFYSRIKFYEMKEKQKEMREKQLKENIKNDEVEKTKLDQIVDSEIKILNEDDATGVNKNNIESQNSNNENEIIQNNENDEEIKDKYIFDEEYLNLHKNRLSSQAKKLKYNDFSNIGNFKSDRYTTMVKQGTLSPDLRDKVENYVNKNYKQISKNKQNNETDGTFIIKRTEFERKEVLQKRNEYITIKEDVYYY